MPRCHADLNAHNVVRSAKKVHLIDFDRGSVRARGLWCDANLVRLRRSILKICDALPMPGCFNETLWTALLVGYRDATPRPARFRLLYQVVCLLVPVACVMLAVRSLRDKSYRTNFAERFGFGVRSNVPSIWVHAVSVGVYRPPPSRRGKELRRRYPEIPLTSTTVTPNGRRPVRARCSPATWTFVSCPMTSPAACDAFSIACNRGSR
jgi:hypothetical protein